MPAYTNDSGEGHGRRQLLVTIAVLVVAVSTAFLPPVRQQRVAAIIRGSVLRPFVAMQEVVALAKTRAVGSQDLQRQLDSVVAVTTGHLVLADENRRLRSLLNLQERIGGGWVPANVVRAGTTGSESMFLLDIGSEQGVKRYSPVIAGQGLVGVVQEVFPNSATAMDWTHPDFRVSAMDPQGMVYGIVRSRRGEFREEDRLEFDGTAFQANLEPGRTIVTSDLSGDWPRAVPIGKVEGLAEADAGWRKSYWLRPMVEVGSVTHVLVGVSPQKDLYGVWPIESTLTDSELAQQIQARQDSLQLLRTVLAAPRPLRDSVLAALLLNQSGTMPSGLTSFTDSLNAAARAPTGMGAGQAGFGRGSTVPGANGTQPGASRGSGADSARPAGVTEPAGAAPVRPTDPGAGAPTGAPQPGDSAAPAGGSTGGSPTVPSGQPGAQPTTPSGGRPPAGPPTVPPPRPDTLTDPWGNPVGLPPAQPSRPDTLRDTNRPPGEASGGYRSGPAAKGRIREGGALPR